MPGSRLFPRVGPGAPGRPPRAGAALLLAAALLGPAAPGEVSVVGGLTQERTVAPGQRVDGEVLLRNSGPNPVDVKIYQTDYLFDAEGKNVYGEPGQLPRSNAGWITFQQQLRTLPPAETVAIQYTLQVPEQPALAGTYWSLIMVEIAGVPPEFQERQEPEVRIGIRHVMRYGVQIITNLGETGTAELKILKKELVVQDGAKRLVVDLENTGERGLRPEVWVELFDQEGKPAGRYAGRKKRLYPGTSIRQELDLSAVPAGAYQGLIVIDNGDDQVFGSRVPLEL